MTASSTRSALRLAVLLASVDGGSGALLPMVRDQVSRSLYTLNSDDSLAVAATLLKQSRVTGAPCYDDNSLDGILSRNDLLKTIAAVPAHAASDPKSLEQHLTTIREQEVWRVMTRTSRRLLP